MIPREIIILAGGLGTRIKNVLGDIPKSLAPVHGRPFIDYLIHYYFGMGLRKFIVCLGHGHQQLSEHLTVAFKKADLHLQVESEPLGTGGAIQQAMTLVDADTVLVVNGDSFFVTDLGMMSAFHHMAGAECTIAVKQVPDTHRYGRLELNSDYSIASFHEKGMQGEGLINGGVYLINKQLFNQYGFPILFSFEKDYLQRYYTDKRIFAIRQDGYFIDIGIPDDLAKAQNEMKLYDSGLDATY